MDDNGKKTVSLSANSVSFAYGGADTPPLISGLDLDLDSAGVIGVIGPNGAGKTTLFKILSGYLKADKGAVLFNGRPVTGMRSYERARALGVVPQSVLTPLPFTVEEIVNMGRSARRRRFAPYNQADAEAVEDAMRLMDVFEFRDRFFNELSGGERQRTIIAMALAQEPDILLLDEPTSQLDLGHAFRLFDSLIKLNSRRGMAVAVISHDLQLAARHCRRIVLFNDGGVLADGAPDEVVTKENINRAFGIDAEVVRDDSGRLFIAAGDRVGAGGMPCYGGSDGRAR